MKEFESHEQAEKYFREVLGYDGAWIFSSAPSNNFKDDTLGKFHPIDRLRDDTMIYYRVKPKLHKFRVPVVVFVTAEDEAAAVSDALSVIKHQCEIGTVNKVE